jgi:hypothetical protein
MATSRGVRMKVIVSHTPGLEVLYCGGLMAFDAPVYVIYACVSDVDYPYFVSKAGVQNSIAACSKFLDFKYEVIFYGRTHYEKFEMMPQSTLIEKFIRRLNFLKPEEVYIPYSNINLSIKAVNYAVKNIKNLDGIVEYGNLPNHNIQYVLSDDLFKQKRFALDLFGKRYNQFQINPVEHYNLYKKREYLYKQEIEDETS